MTLLSPIETYYDAAPRPTATTQECGPFTIFVQTAGDGWPFYARPAVAYDGPVHARHVEAVRQRQRELGVPERIEWVHETTPTLQAAAREAGLHVAECPLLVLPHSADALAPPLPAGCEVRMLAPDSSDPGPVMAAVHAAFAGSDDPDERPASAHLTELMRSGLLAMAGAYGVGGAIGGGTHAPRGTTTELTGIAVLPRARRRGVGAAITAALVADARDRGVTTVFLSAQDDTVARVYERIGFQRLGTACIAEPPEV